MKKYLVFIIMIFAATGLYAQSDNNGNSGNEKPQMQTLFKSDFKKIGAYAAPDLKVTQVKKEVGIMTGGRVGAIFDKSFSFGFAGYSLQTRHNVALPDAPNARLDLNYGGLLFEYINSSNSLVHFTVNTLVGGGRAALANRDWDDNDFQHSGFFVVEPGAMLDVNVSKHIRIGAGIGYRFITGVDMKNLKSSELSGLTANLTFKFGVFNGFEIPDFIKRHIREH